MKQRLYDHFSIHKFIGALFGMMLIFVLTAPVIVAANHLYERFSDDETWFEYYAVRPIKDSFKVGETLAFNSFIEYRQPLSIRWEDTLFCTQDDGVKKYTTQFWPADGSTEKKRPGTVNIDVDPAVEALNFWEYYIEKPDSDAIDCYMTGFAVGYTPLGYEKRQYYVTENFSVNK